MKGIDNMDLDKELKSLKELDEKRNQAHTDYCEKFENFANSIKDDVINKIKNLITNVIDNSFNIDYDPESGEPTMNFYFLLDGESEFMIEDDNKYYEIIWKDKLIKKLDDELKCGIFIDFKGNRKGEIDGKKQT